MEQLAARLDKLEASDLHDTREIWALKRAVETLDSNGRHVETELAELKDEVNITKEVHGEDYDRLDTAVTKLTKLFADMAKDIATLEQKLSSAQQ